ncbi:hypothetical protein NVI2019_OHEONHNH_04023 (plasmid) [Providencia alcalifaciens]|nr:hypothetical protein NVI2019_OGMBKCAO_03906 [Providencia alcalifaciens]CAG9436218.1 hypothetical protein NVI2019_PLFLNFOB_04023 [Providencia alcalifaciens]CAG9436231.1 hypothetical protein NVI2019_ANGEOOBF_04024 [Providencia alcalifaciens]CAG9436252.1 hypothetical protein NVI2019_KOLGMIGM_04025 [Providencia alcalifaciens]CAG9437519.1 hypothetical protein NVI2019_OHEONHNH_04023 [Providencia alcalifaciens]
MISRRLFLGGCVAFSTLSTFGFAFAKATDANVSQGYMVLSKEASKDIYNFFSYACGHCYRFHPYVQQLRQSLE